MNDNGIIDLSNNSAQCKISLWSADLLSFKPKGEEQDVFWVGNLNKFDKSQAIRGGIPVCWPRFAAEKLNDNLPRHGFARISEWTLQSLDIFEDKTEAEFLLVPDIKYNVPATAMLRVKVTDKLEYSLTTTNNSDKPFDFSEALHCYFNISSVENIVIKGLAGRQYKSSLDGNIYTQNADLKINGEFDAAFLNHSEKIEIEDKKYNRIISIEKSGSKSTVVWNPAKDLAEMSPNQYKNFVCVEPANQGDFFVHLAPKSTHTIAMTIQIKKIK